ncbi:MAG: hypothetical protein SFY68_03080 [Candidatus Sumerlaeia bacterium]|nr:hypothetical protein [Candidatus Sumerlaeia bacterium]
MINPLLERRYADCAELEEAWKEFLDQFKEATKKDKSELDPNFDQAFLSTKARIAMLHDSFLESLKHDQNIAQTMLDIVNRSISGRHLRKMNDSDLKKVEQEWHECYLLLNSTVVGLSEERERLAGINEFNHKMTKIQTTIKLQVMAFLKSLVFKFIVAFAVLAGIWFGVPDEYWNKVRSVKGIGKPYSSYLDFQRTTLGFTAPYSSLDKFIAEELSGEKLPTGFTAEATTSADPAKQLQDDTAFFDQLFDIDGVKAGEFLRSAETYMTYRLTDTAEGKDCTSAIFFWFEPGKAKQFQRQFSLEVRGTSTEATILKQTFSVYYNQNVLVIISDHDIETREKLISRFFPASKG